MKKYLTHQAPDVSKVRRKDIINDSQKDNLKELDNLIDSMWKEEQVSDRKYEKEKTIRSTKMHSPFMSFW